jgi:predicted molibdopterin-dependent oxidoreductase YjgC
LTSPLINRGGEFVEIAWSEALDIVANRIELIREEDGGNAFGVIGGARGTNEDAYALSKFARVVLETNNVDARVGDDLASHFLAGTVDRALISDLDDADTILIWGPDLKEEHPTLYLRARRAAQELGVTLIVAHPRATGLDDRATHKLTYRPGGGFALLDAIAKGDHPEVSHALTAGKVVAIVGQACHADGPKLAESVAALARNKAGSIRIMPLARRGNIYGALDMGLAPDLLPGRTAVDAVSIASLASSWGEIPVLPGRDTRRILEGMEAGEVRCLFLVGADPVRDLPDPRVALDGLEAAEYVVSVDLFLNDSNRYADLILPASGFAEKEGTVTNLEGRVQKLNAIRSGVGQSRPDWAILVDIAERAGRPLGLAAPETIAKEISEVAPAYTGVTWDLLEWERRDGAVVPLSGSQPINHIPVALAGPRAPRAALTLHVARTMYDDGVLMRRSPSLHPLAPGAVAHLNPVDARKLGAQAGNPVHVVTKQGEGEFSVVIDEGTPAGVVYVPFNQVGGAPLGTDPVVRVKAVAK